MSREGLAVKSPHPRGTQNAAFTVQDPHLRMQETVRWKDYTGGTTMQQAAHQGPNLCTHFGHSSVLGRCRTV